jgi:hypothetical protein
MASTVSRKRPRAQATPTRDEHLKQLMKQAVREVLAEMDDDWDRQMTADVEAGRLDPLIAKARAEIRQGKTVPMDLRRR